MLLKYQSFRFVPSIPCVKCTCITFAIVYNILLQIYQISIIWNKLSNIISNHQVQKSSRSCHLSIYFHNHVNQTQSELSQPANLCQRKRSECEPKLNLCKRFVLHSQPFISHSTICLSKALAVFLLTLQYTFRSVPHISADSYTACRRCQRICQEQQMGIFPIGCSWMDHERRKLYAQH